MKLYIYIYPKRSILTYFLKKISLQGRMLISNWEEYFELNWTNFFFRAQTLGLKLFLFSFGEEREIEAERER
jgi:hypothetical protein